MRHRFAVCSLTLLCWAPALRAAPTPDPPDAVTWLRRYLSADTTNPPGHEEVGAALLGAILETERIPYRLLVHPSGRTSLYARLAPATPSAPDLVLLHHLDVVPAKEGWRYPPFGAEVHDGLLYGRGAIDIKGLGAAQLAAFVALHRARTPLRRGVIYLAVADEERGGLLGTQWILETYPELFANVEAVLGEGGANRSVDGAVRWWGIEFSQKRPIWFAASVTARGGHGSKLQPFSATHQLLQGLARLTAYAPRFRLSPPVRKAAISLAPYQNDPVRQSIERVDGWVTPAGELQGAMPMGFDALLTDTVQVTVLEAGDTINVIPRTAKALIDARLLPDTDDEQFMRWVHEKLGDGISTEVLLSEPRSPPSPTDSPFFGELRSFLEKEAPVTYHVGLGMTDSRYFRRRGIAAYGYSPFAIDGNDGGGVHAADEFISVREFEKGVERMTKLLFDLAGPAK